MDEAARMVHHHLDQHIPGRQCTFHMDTMLASRENLENSLNTWYLLAEEYHDELQCLHRIVLWRDGYRTGHLALEDYMGTNDDQKREIWCFNCYEYGRIVSLLESSPWEVGNPYG